MNGSTIITGVIVILGLVGLYYLYLYLFGASVSFATIVTKRQDASTYGGTGDSGAGIVVQSKDLPPLYMGGEFSISMWINITNWSQVRAGKNKSILRIGNATYDTIRIYLGPSAPQLHVRFDTHQGGTSTENRLSNVNDTTFTSSSVATTIESIGTLRTNKNECDILQIDMQRWVNIVVSVNGMTSDVYLDGKLARSCVLNNYFNVSPKDYNLTLLGNGGFGGYISTTQVYGQALSPDLVYQNYMAGPEPITNFMEYITSFMSLPKVV